MKRRFRIQDLRFMNRQRGFTLIELLIVIAIIGVLTSLLTVNFISARQRGRDAQRKSDVRQIQAALELYRTDQSSYPDDPLPTCGNSLSAGGNVYMKSIPCDPSGGSYQFNSGPNGQATSYTLVACLENTGDSDPNTSGTSPLSGTITCPTGTQTGTKYYTVTNP